MTPQMYYRLLVYLSMEELNWQKIREYYPIVGHGVYLKNASISAIHRDVLKEMQFWQEDIANRAAIDEGRFFELLQHSKEVISNFLNCLPEDVALLENSSHNMNLVAIMMKKDLLEGRNEVIVPADEFPSSLLPFYYHGFNIIQVPTNNGHFSEEDLFKHITPQTNAVVTSVVQFGTGLRLDPKKLSDFAGLHKVPLILNTTQSLGVFPINLLELNVAALTSSCHKWLGAGIGQAIFYLNPEFRKERPYPLAGWCSVEDPFAMKNEMPVPRLDVGALQLGSLPFALIAGVVKAIEVIKGIGPEAIQRRVLSLSHKLRKAVIDCGLKPVGATVPTEESGIVTFPVENADDLVEFLESRKIYVNNRRGFIRASVHIYNTPEDIEIFHQALKDYKKL
jgi:selenocysteine lyase/cysteine desulfurase